MKHRLLTPEAPPRAAVADWMARAYENGTFSNNGPLVKEFEKRLGGALGRGVHVVTTTSGTTALTTAIRGAGLRRGARILVPDFTFAATANAVRNAGYTPVFADVDHETWLLTPETAARSDCDAVVPVAALGNPVPAESWENFSRAAGIPVVIDAAGAFCQQIIPGNGIDVCFSTHATKALMTGEGGFIASREEHAALRYRRWANHGFEAGGDQVQSDGFNGKLSEFAAAVGLAALERWPGTQMLRVAAWERFVKVFGEANTQRRPLTGVYMIAPVLVKDAKRALGALESAGVPARQWYMPRVSRHNGFRGSEVTGQAPVVDYLERKMICIPFSPAMTVMDFLAIRELLELEHDS